MAEITVDIKIVIPLASYRKIMAYAEICEQEISGFADIEYNSDKGILTVGEVYLMKQEVTGGTTDLDEEDIAKFVTQMIKEGKTQLPRLWWHSHVNMGTFFSGTDEATMKYLENDGFTVALVVNKRKEFKAKFILWKPFKIEVEDIPVEIDFGYVTIPKALEDEVKKKVKSKVWNNFNGKGKFKGKGKWAHGDFKQIAEDIWQGTEYSAEKGTKRLEAELERVRKGLKTESTNLLRLPRLRVDALKRIADDGLIGEWDDGIGDFVYTDQRNGLCWYDFWGVLKTGD